MSYPARAEGLVNSTFFRLSVTRFIFIVSITNAWKFLNFDGENSYDVVTEVQDSGLEVSEFELPSCYNVRFWTNTFEKVTNPFISTDTRQIESLLFFYKDIFDIE